MPSTRASAADITAFDLNTVQEEIGKTGVDGWLFYFFHGNDPIALRILHLDTAEFFSRRWFYFIPENGTPKKLVHRIEAGALDSLPGEKVTYTGWHELEDRLSEMLAGVDTVAMQYSPRGAIPYVSRVDAGIVELVRALGISVVSSADLVQVFEARWSDSQLSSHVEAGEILRRIVFEAFGEIRASVENNRPLTEYELQQFILRRYEDYGLTANHAPIVAANANSGNPHYQPTIDRHATIGMNDFVLVDIWAKKKAPADAVYADITWTGYVGKSVPQKYIDIFTIVRDARDSALEFVRESVGASREIFGWQVDDVARAHISQHGYGQHFVHRTGHSIGREVHGNGANIDNYETRDERRLIPGTGFSIEPGIYLPEFGVRSEIDVYIGTNEIVVAGQPIQTDVVPILAQSE
jgi:Xaa-Pro aminopeptidase